jgi:hypothetical protein
VSEEILIDNDIVRVTRVTLTRGESYTRSRLRRVVVALTANEIEKTLIDGRPHRIRRKMGEVTYLEPSTHTVCNKAGDKHVANADSWTPHVTLVIEVKS